MHPSWLRLGLSRCVPEAGRSGEVEGAPAFCSRSERGWGLPFFIHLELFPQEEGQASKTGEFDATVIFDNLSRPEVVKILVELKANTRPDEFSFPFGSAEYEKVFRKAAIRAGLQKSKPVPHMLRHGGASSDYLRRKPDGGPNRSLKDIQLKGKWRSFSSVRRFETAGALLKAWEAVDPKVKTACYSSSRILTTLHAFL